MNFTKFTDYLRKLYLELEPGAEMENLSFSWLLKNIANKGVFSSDWAESTNIKKMLETRNKVAHAGAEGIVALNEIRNSTNILFRLGADINEKYTFYIVDRFLDGAFVIKQSAEGGFDFIATSVNLVLAFDVKTIRSGRLTARAMNEMIDKASNYSVITSKPLYYVVFYFAPIDRIWDNNPIGLRSQVDAILRGDEGDRIQFFQLETGDHRSIREQIENALKSVLARPRK